MRPVLVLIVICMFIPYMALAQSPARIIGIIKDAETTHVLEGATISVLNSGTGIYINHAVSNKKGEFTITGLPQHVPVDVIVSFTGFSDTTASFTLNTRQLNTGTWYLKPAQQELEEVTVTTRKPPFIVKKDTIEFDATAFKSLPTDMLQDLLSKLPGIIIDEQGNVTVNGKKVDKIKVDGRDFFSSNLSTVMENLPGYTISKVQVYDTRERGTEHKSIIKPATENVTLNLTLKKENKKGSFGHVGAGYGTKDRYSGNVFLNRFNEGKRFGIFLNNGNLNPFIFSGKGSGGPSQELVQNGSGVLKNLTLGGINLNNDFGKKTRLDASYFGNSSDNYSETKLERTNILPDSSFLYNSLEQANYKNQSHAINANFFKEIDSLHSISLTPVINFTKDNSDRYMNAASSSTSGNLINTQRNHYRNNTGSFSLNNTFNYLLSSIDRQTNLSVTWIAGYTQSDGKLRNESGNIFYNSSTADTIDQDGKTTINDINNNLSVNLSRHLNKHFSTIINYTFIQHSGINNREIYNYDQLSGKHDDLDSLYSSHNKNNGITHLPTVSIGYTGKKLMIELGAGYRWINQENRIVWKDSSVLINQHNFSPKITTAYRFSKNSRWIVNYSVNTQQPTPEQLAPVPDNTNPLYIRIGNPFLHTAITHNVNTQLNFFTSDYKWRLNVQGNTVLSNNQIVDDTYYDSLGRQVTTYQNTRGNHQVNFGVNGGAVIKLSDWSLNINLNADIRNNVTTGFVNRQLNQTNSTQLSPGIHMGLAYKGIINILAGTAIDMYKVNYSIKEVTDVDYNIKRANFGLQVNSLKFLTFHGMLMYMYNSQLPDNFQRSRTLVNLGAQYSLLRSRKLSIGIAVNDLLNDNVNTTQSITPTAIENTQFNTLRRYAMLTISYRLSEFY